MGGLAFHRMPKSYRSWGVFLQNAKILQKVGLFKKASFAIDGCFFHRMQNFMKGGWSFHSMSKFCKKVSSLSGMAKFCKKFSLFFFFSGMLKFFRRSFDGVPNFYKKQLVV